MACNNYPEDVLLSVSNFLHADWLRVMFNKSTLGHGNEAMMVKFVFLFLACTVLLETLKEMVIKTFSVIMKNNILTSFLWTWLIIVQTEENCCVNSNPTSLACYYIKLSSV